MITLLDRKNKKFNNLSKIAQIWKLELTIKNKSVMWKYLHFFYNTRYTPRDLLVYRPPNYPSLQPKVIKSNKSKFMNIILCPSTHKLPFFLKFSPVLPVDRIRLHLSISVSVQGFKQYKKIDDEDEAIERGFGPRNPRSFRCIRFTV